MQLTRLDRWLKEKFAIETHVQVLRMPERLPRGIKVIDLPDIPGRRFQHMFIIRKSSKADELFAILKDESMMYSTQIVTRDAWYVKFLAPKEKSFTWSIISWLIILAAIAGAATLVIRLLQDAEIRENLRDALEILKG